MFSFDGDFRRKPLQNLGGASQKSDRQTIIRNAQVERQKREQNRKEMQSSTKIQAHVRSFINRQRAKKVERANFDEHFKRFGITNDESLQFLLKRLVFFYDIHLDGDRMISFCQIILKNPKCLFQKTTDTIWAYRVKKLLNCCMIQVQSDSHSSAIPMRVLEVFTDIDTVLKHIHNPYVAQQYLEVVFKYLIEQKYFKKIWVFVNERIPSNLDADDNFKSPMGDAIIQMIMRPLRLIELSETNLRDQILSSFACHLLCPEYTSQIRFFVIPEIAKQNYPFIPFIEMIAKTRQKEIDYRKTILIDIEPERRSKEDEPEFSSFLLYAVLALDRLMTSNQMNDKCAVRNYFSVLSALIGNVKKLPKHSNFSSDSDDEDDDHDDQIMYAEMEINVLTSVLDLMNDTQRIIFIAQRVDWFLDEPDMMLDLCIICHSLMTCHRSFDDFKLLFMLALKPKFIRSLWYTLTSHSAGRGLTSPISLISKGLAVSKQEADRLIPFLASFCTLFGRLISTLHDGEFTNDNDITISKIMPFTLQEIVPLCTTLKEICLGLVELAFPETRSNLTEHYRTMLSSLNQRSNTDNQITSAIWSHLLKVCVALLRQIHTRDLRINFCPEGHWTAKLLNLPLDKAELHITRRRGMRPFQPLRDFTRDDICDGPPLSTKQIRSITILREIPFVVEFNRRVSIFQGLLAADKLRSQGDLQGFLQGPSINIMVRRSHLYEDAFDKLSTENEPDLRPRFRVQLINVTGLEEAGIDGGGVFREFLSELLKTAFDPHRGFFMITKDNMLYPNPGVGKIIEDYQRHYYFIGRILGKALYENLLVELPLAEFFLSKLAGKHSDVDVHQLASLDPDLHRNLMSLKAYDGDVADLGLDFTVVCDELGEKRVEELKLNGNKIMVNTSNRIEYIQLMADFKLNRQIRSQCIAFRQGLANILPIEWLYMFSNKELQVLISGAEVAVDILDLRLHTHYSGDFHADHPTIHLFWKVLEDFTDLQKRQLLKFVTSCSRPPLLGFKDLDPIFCIQNAGSTDRLPSASTCMNLLKLPAFETEEILKEKLLYAIVSGAGFELS